jgi:hypothetical protein
LEVRDEFQKSRRRRRRRLNAAAARRIFKSARAVQTDRARGGEGQSRETHLVELRTCPSTAARGGGSRPRGPTSRAAATSNPRAPVSFRCCERKARERKKKREVSESFSGFEFVRRDGVIDARGRYAAGAIDPIARASERSCQHAIQGARAITGKIFSTRA